MKTKTASDEAPRPERKQHVTRNRKRTTSARTDNKIYQLVDGQLVNLYSIEIDRTDAERVWQGTCPGSGTLNVFFKDQKGGPEWYFIFLIQSLKVGGTVRATSNGEALNLVAYFRALGFSIPDKVS